MSVTLLNTTKYCIQNIQQSLSRIKISIGSTLIADQKRTKITLQTPRLRNPVWFLRKKRTIHEDFITNENKGFVKEFVYDQYGPPSIIKGVQTYRDSIIKTQEPITNIEQKPWAPHMIRSGVIARKIGQYPLWKKDGTKIRTSLLQVIDNHVIKYYPPEKYQPTQKPQWENLSKFGCLLVGAESTDPSLLTKEYCGLFENSGVMPKKTLARFMISPSAALAPGTPLNVSHFRVDDYVDVRGKTIDRGFQGVCKRHGFKGMPASHGVTKTHRRPGNVGSGGQKARIWPGTKMPGHMGNRWRILRGLKIWRINTKYNVMWVTGSAIAGPTNSLVYVFDTMLPLRRTQTAPPFPTAGEANDDQPLVEDIWSDELHDFRDSSIFFKNE